MKFNSLEELIGYIYTNIMKESYDKYIKLSISDSEILMFVFETEIPIRISYHDVYDENFQNLHKQIFSEVYAELLRCDIGKGWLKELDEICTLIDENAHIFEKIIKK
jgi:hypothetical protein